MPEGQEVPKIESGANASPPNNESGKQKTVLDYSFSESFSKRQLLLRQKETASPEAVNDIVAIIKQLENREKQLIDEVEQEGGLLPINQELELLELMLDRGELSPSDILDSKRSASKLDDDAGVEKSDVHAGVRKWYLEKNLDVILERLKAEKVPASVSSKVKTAVNQVASRTIEENGFTLPQDKEAQLRLMRNSLDKIENSNRDCHDYSITYLVRSLETALGEMDPEVAEEVKARLAVHDSSELIRQAGGWISRDSEKVGPGYTIGSAATEANRRNHGLDRSTIALFLKEGLPGLKISEAWDMIQEANFNYPKYLGLVNQESEISLRTFLDGILSKDDINEIISNLRKKIANPIKIINGKEVIEDKFKGDFREFLLEELKRKKIDNVDSNLLPKFFSAKVKGFELKDDEISAGSVPTNFYIDSETDRKNAVRNYIIHKLGVGGGTDAEKSFQLAEKLTIATLEISVFNRTSTFGNDQLAEIIGLKGWRSGRSVTGRARGPLITEKMIDGFGTSWIRLQREEGKPLVAVNQPVFARDVDLQAIREGNWVYYSTVIVSRYNLLKELLLNTAPKPEEVDERFLEQAVVYFDTADRPEKINESLTKGGPKQLRLIWILGLFDIALSDPRLNWTEKEFGLLTKALIKDQLSEKAGTFLHPDQMEWIKKQVRYVSRVSRLTFLRATESIIDSIFTTGSPGGARKGSKK